MNPQVLAYTAGIVDGEGCIAISSHTLPKRKVQRYLVLEVTVTNTNVWLVQWLKMQFGGGVSMHSRANRSRNSKDCWRWKVCSRQAVEFLKLILPYLQIKRPEAEVAINFQSHKKNWGSKHQPPEVIAIEEAQKILLQSYKHGTTLERVSQVLEIT